MGAELLLQDKLPIEVPRLNLKTTRRVRSSDAEFVKYVCDKNRKWLDAEAD